MTAEVEMLNLVGLFAGIGGVESGFHHELPQVRTSVLCEVWPPAQAVLRDHFPEAIMQSDVRDFADLPDETHVLTAGFPCTDLSQAGRTAGIEGAQSGLVRYVFAALVRSAEAGRQLPWLMIENVSNMLSLDRGAAMTYLVDELEGLGYRWAYRTVDSRFTGVPQRRKRVILVASTVHDPRTVLFADDAGEPPTTRYRDDAFGFYWTEGERGLGWAQDAVPTLKAGSTVGIPSPPAIWVPENPTGRKLVVPGIEDAERLQGFPAGWTAAAADGRRDGDRWKLVGNAVTVGVSRWVARRLKAPGVPHTAGRRLVPNRWPRAAYGDDSGRWAVDVSEYPTHEEYMHLTDLVDVERAVPLSRRAAAGFLGRLARGNLGRHPGFRSDVAEHVASFVQAPPLEAIA